MAIRALVAATAAFGFNVGAVAQPLAGPAPIVMTLSVDDAIGPAMSDYVQRGIEAAEERRAELVVLQLDTPGGLDSSMRDIVQAILASRVPVATFVYPQGARAASAGTYILYASHIAAMAPATTTGAATPVAIGGASERDSGEAAPDAPTPPAEPASASERKAINDAVSYIRSLAEQRGRNADWAERAVRSADSISARAALELGVIDIIAANLDDLLRQLDGREVVVRGQVVTLATRDAVFETVEPDWRTRLLAVITNPEIAYVLLLIGIYGLLFEGYNPGAIVPGVVGAICLLLALFAFQVLPVNYAGLGLILLGVVLMAAEFFVPSFGALGLGGIAAFVFGSLILIDTEAPGFERPTGLITAVATLGGAGLLGIVWVAMRARSRPIVSGIEEMMHLTAEALADFEEEGQVWVHGERWHARSKVPVRKGQRLKINEVRGLVLEVEPSAQRTTVEEKR